MGVCQGIGDLHRIAENKFQRKSARGDLGTERLTVDMLHCNVAGPLKFADLVDRTNVRVI